MDRKAAVIAVGNEVVQGYVANSNAAWLSQQLAEIGFDVQYLLAVTDRLDDLTRRLKAALDEGLLVVTTGGIGPTFDDRTREAAAAALGAELKLDMDDLARLQERYSAMGRSFPAGSERQCTRPAGARLVRNAFGTASCFLAPARRSLGEGAIAALPGVPREMKGVWGEEMRKALIEEFGLPLRWHARELRVFGIPESELNNQIADLLGDNPEGAILVDDAVIRLRWRVSAPTIEEANGLLAPVVEEARARLGDLVFAEGDVSLEQATVQALAERGITAACAESCTGGMIAHLLTNVPGSSNVLLESAVTYSERAKHERLGVKTKTLKEHGPVSQQTAEEMARGIRRTSGAEICVAVTGIAGPGGGTPDKPVGTVWLGAAMGDDVKTWHLRVPGDRELVKWRTARTAINTLRLAAIHGKLPEHITHWTTPP